MVEMAARSMSATARKQLPRSSSVRAGSAAARSSASRTRSRSSAAAASVKVIATRRSMVNRPAAMRLSMRATSTLVLPVPAPASTKKVRSRSFRIFSRAAASVSAGDRVIGSGSPSPRPSPRGRGRGSRGRGRTLRLQGHKRGVRALASPGFVARGGADAVVLAEAAILERAAVELARHRQEGAGADAVGGVLHHLRQARIRPIVGDDLAALELAFAGDEAELGADVRASLSDVGARCTGVQHELQMPTSPNAVIRETVVAPRAAALVVDDQHPRWRDVDAVDRAAEAHHAAIGERHLDRWPAVWIARITEGTLEQRRREAIFVTPRLFAIEVQVEVVQQASARVLPGDGVACAALCLEVLDQRDRDRLQAGVIEGRERLLRGRAAIVQTFAEEYLERFVDQAAAVERGDRPLLLRPLGRLDAQHVHQEVLIRTAGPALQRRGRRSARVSRKRTRNAPRLARERGEVAVEFRELNRLPRASGEQRATEHEIGARGHWRVGEIVTDGVRGDDLAQAQLGDVHRRGGALQTVVARGDVVEPRPLRPEQFAEVRGEQRGNTFDPCDDLEQPTRWVARASGAIGSGEAQAHRVATGQSSEEPAALSGALTLLTA